MVDIQIYGMHRRDDMIAALCTKLSLPAENVHYDDRPEGGTTLYAAKKAWLAPVPEGVTHRIVLEDDAEVCSGFSELVGQIAAVRPFDIFSFFPYEFLEEHPLFDTFDTPYVKTEVLSGVGIMMPVAHIAPCFAFIEKQFRDKTEANHGIQFYAHDNGVDIITTIPSLVQHGGDESIITPGAPIRRTRYFEENPTADWNSDKLIAYVRPEWFFSNRGTMRKNAGVLRYVDES